ncbi:MAG: hypothetical protein PVI21_00300 [Candidatus Woesebacteria bacterium]
MSIEEYYRTDDTAEGKIITVLDPSSGSPLLSNIPPYCLMQDPRLKIGADFLSKIGRRLTINLVLSTHGASTDMACVINQRPEAFSGIVPFCGVETDWKSDGSDFPSGPSVIFAAGSQGRKEFQAAQLKWLDEQHIAPLPCEYEETRPTELSKHLNYLLSVYSSAGKDSLPQKRDSAIALGVYQAIRHWIMPMQLGYWLSRLDIAGALPKTSPMYVPLILGSWHAPTEFKIGRLGANALTYRVVTGNECGSGSSFMKLVKTGCLPESDIMNLLT